MMPTATPIKPIKPSPVGASSPPNEIPPLENGDLLTRAEFYRRWEAMPGRKRAERIEGIVYMAAAVRRKRRAEPHSDMKLWIGTFRAETPNTHSAIEATIQLDADNDVQPDVYLLIAPECGGQCRFTEDDYIAAGPELVVEIFASSASKDLHQKFQVYRRSGVKEYVVWKTIEQEIVWFRLQDDVFVDVEAKDGLLKSKDFPGLWLDAAAMLRGDLRTALKKLRQGLDAPAHADFVEQLESRRTPGN